jgi:hypothetical protein
MRPLAGVLLSLLLTACNQGEVKPPPRPSTVPTSAIWSGGSDGGAWYACSFSAKDSNACSIYSDDGTLWIRAHYRLQDEKRAATISEFQHPFVDFIPDVRTIYLEGGKKMVRIDP